MLIQFTLFITNMPQQKSQDSSQKQESFLSNHQPWVQFPNTGYSFINDGFLHNLAALKLNLKGQKGGVSIKQTVSEAKTVKHLTDQTRFWVNVHQSRSIFAKIKTGDTLKLHYDNGPSTIFDRPINLYAGLSFRRQIKHFNWRFGLNHVQNGLNTDNRIRIDNKDKFNASFSTRTTFRKRNFTFGLLASYDLSKNVLEKNSLLLGYDLKENSSLYFRAQNSSFRHQNPKSLAHWFDTFTFDAISKYNQSTKLGLQLNLQPSKRVLKEAIIVVQKGFEDQISTKFKVKLNGQVQLNCLIKLPIPFNKSSGSFSLGVNGSKLLKESRYFNFGIQLQFNA